jgi:hypothetical protein
VLLFAIQCLCDDPAHHMGWLGGMIPVVVGFVAMAAALIAILVAERWGQKRRRVEPTDALLTSKSSGARRCPFCHGPLRSVRVEASLRCSSCDVQHHVDCWQEHGGCTVLGCSASGARRQELTRGVGRARTPDAMRDSNH